MSRTRFDAMVCPVARTLDVIGDWWSLLVIREAMLGTRRFSDFAQRLGISKKVLSDRLSRLIEGEILELVEAGRVGSRMEYRLTERGRDLFTVVTALRQWGERWIYRDQPSPIEVVDRGSDRPLRPLQVTDADGSPVTVRDVRLVMRPPQ